MRRFYFFLLIFLFIWNCEKPDAEKVKELSFRVNKNLVGEPYRNELLGFSFCPPKSCESISKDILKQAGSAMLDSSQSDSCHYELLCAALNVQEQFICLVTGIDNLCTENDMKNYLDAIKLKMSQYDIRPSVFYYNGFKIQQILIMMPEKIIFKLIVPQSEKKSFQIDYIIPEVYYKKNLEAIESSIGSLTKF